MPHHGYGHDGNAKPDNAPGVGAFYFEDAAAVLKQSGYMIGRVECTCPPREKGLCVDGPDNVPLREYRVVRCTVSGADGQGDPVCDVLIVKSPQVQGGS